MFLIGLFFWGVILSAVAMMVLIPLQQKARLQRRKAVERKNRYHEQMKGRVPKSKSSASSGRLKPVRKKKVEEITILPKEMSHLAMGSLNWKSRAKCS